MRFPLAVLVLILVFGAQERPRPPVVALRNATLALDASTTIEKATLVLRGGLVEAAGVDAKIPADAEIIDATGLYVYPGFVDGLTSSG
ncbi:MAG TPA: amidohydrolase, partial [Planctomycetota bacterium]|nr:amidohydrolase [Planctomycetota bacterium]